MARSAASSRVGKRPIAVVKKNGLHSAMARSLLVISCVLVAACGPQIPDNVAVGQEASPVIPTEQFKWQECVPPGVDGFGNKWWGSFSFCKGDVRVIVDGYSAYEMAASVTYEVGTRRCPTGVDFASVEDDAFFDKSLQDQTEELKKRITPLLLQLKEPCGTPPDVTQFFDDAFDQKFRELANSYWMHVPKDKIRAGRARELRNR